MRRSSKRRSSRRSSELTPNAPIDRFSYIVKTYIEKQPWVVLDTLSVIFETIGVDNAERDLGEELNRQSEAWGEKFTRMVSRLRSTFDAQGRLHPGVVQIATEGDFAGISYRVQNKFWWFGDPTVEKYLESYRRPVSTLSERLSLILELAESPTFADGTMRESHEADAIFPWVARELSKLSKVVLRTDGDRALRLALHEYHHRLFELRRSTNAIAQWAKATRTDIMKMSLDEVLEAIKGFRVKRRVEHGEVVYKFKNGWAVESLKGKRQLDCEAGFLSHCVYNYKGDIERGESVIYSLRDPDGVPYVTIEWQPREKGSLVPGHLAQVFGQSNSTIGSETFNEYVFQAGQDNDPPLTREEVPEVVEAIAQMTGEFVAKALRAPAAQVVLWGLPLPEELTSVGDLELKGYPYPLPEGLTSVGGNLELRDYDHPLPDGLAYVGRFTDLHRYKHPLPEGLTSVGGGLYLEDYPHPLPEGLTSVGGNLYRGDYKHPLPKGLRRGGR